MNLSPAQFATGSVSAIVAAALEETGLEPHRLELEITETLLLGNTEAIMAELRALKAMGVAIVMDDFGTGYSSLSYLWRFPFDKIKIDRSFMQGFDGSGRDAETVVKTIIGLGRELNMRVTVEGVETAEAGGLSRQGRRRPGPGLLLRPAGPRLRGRRQYPGGFSAAACPHVRGRGQSAAGQLTRAQPRQAHLRIDVFNPPALSSARAGAEWLRRWTG